MENYNYPSIVIGTCFIDVTNTDMTRGNSLERNQQRNWETVLQCFGLITQPIVVFNPVLVTDDNREGINLNNYINRAIKLGTSVKFMKEFFRPNLNTWVFAIASEHPEVFGKDCNRLVEVFDMIPVINNLTEEIILEPSVFQTKDPELINIHFMSLEK